MAFNIKYFSETKGYSKLRSEYTNLKMTHANTGEKTQISLPCAILLERFEYWTKRHNGNLVDLIIEEKKYDIDAVITKSEQKELNEGWFFKSLNEIKEYSFMPKSKRTIKRSIDHLVASNWVARRKSQIVNLKNLNDYRLLIGNIGKSLNEVGSTYPIPKETHIELKKRLG